MGNNFSSKYELFRNVKADDKKGLNKNYGIFLVLRRKTGLQLTSLPIESIALSCGYHDPLVFTKAFKQMKKMSPTAYRREMQKGETRRNKEYLKQVEDFINQINSLK